MSNYYFYQYPIETKVYSTEGERITPDKWGPNEPHVVRPPRFRKAVFAVSLFFVATATIPAPAMDSWVQPTNEPIFDIQRRQDSYPASFWIQYQTLEIPTVDRWVRPLSEPLFDSIRRQDSYPSSFYIEKETLPASSLDGWGIQQAQPIFKKKPNPAQEPSYSFEAIFEEEITIDKWFVKPGDPHLPLRNPNVGPAFFIDDLALMQLETPQLDKWIGHHSIPVWDLPRRQWLYPFADQDRTAMLEAGGAEPMVWWMENFVRVLPFPRPAWFKPFHLDPVIFGVSEGFEDLVEFDSYLGFSSRQISNEIGKHRERTFISYLNNEIHKGDVGTKFLSTIQDNDVIVDISGAISKQLLFQKPDGTNITQTALFDTNGTDGKIYYTTASGDLNVIGRWSIQSKIVLAGGTWISDRYKFQVQDVNE